MRQIQTSKNTEELFESLERTHHEKQSNENKKLSFTQDWNRDHESARRVRKDHKNFGRNFIKEADRVEKVRRRAQASAWKVWKYVCEKQARKRHFALKNRTRLKEA